MPRSLPFSFDLQAREAFFTYFAPSISKYWEFLKQYHYQAQSPYHLTLAIEAVSLAYLWHQVYSDAVLVAARERYVSALHVTNQFLKSSCVQGKDSTLMVALLLDLFEKITDSVPQTKKSWVCHIHGGLALVRLRGLEQFQDPFSIRLLVRLCSNYITSCIATGSPVLSKAIAIRAFVGQHINIQDPHWQILDSMIHYANLRPATSNGTLSIEEYLGEAILVDLKLKAVDLDMPSSWQYSTVILEHRSDRHFDHYFDSYPNRDVCQGRNGLRLIRILLNESLLEHYLASPTSDQQREAVGLALDNIQALAYQICASVPQYVDCGGAARQGPPIIDESNPSNQTPGPFHDLVPRGSVHTHTSNHLLDCYTLIFPLYVAGRSNAHPEMRPWVVKQLHYLGSHFYIRSAEVVAQILEQGRDIDPWEVYSMLGSYAFAA